MKGRRGDAPAETDTQLHVASFGHLEARRANREAVADLHLPLHLPRLVLPTVVLLLRGMPHQVTSMRAHMAAANYADVSIRNAKYVRSCGAIGCLRFG